jgi:prophage regulatory protein
MTLVLLKLPEVCRRRALQATSVYGQVKDGTFTPPVKLTARSAAWPEHEVDAINRAVVAGKSKAEIRTLVSELIAARTQQSGAAA